MLSGKSLLLGIVMGALALPALSACSSRTDQEYIMGLRDGRLIVTRGRPDFRESEGVYSYRGQDGIRAIIAQDQVVQIIQR